MNHCTKCHALADNYCIDCELPYCTFCFKKRHSKGSFISHTKKYIELPSNYECDECEIEFPLSSLVYCKGCLLNYCEGCSTELHKHGSLKVSKTNQ